MASTSVGSASSHYCLRWNNHLSNMLDAFEHLFETEGLTDVTLWLNRKQSIKCHRIVLAACSAVFEHLFLENPNKPHFYVMLPGVKYAELKLILEYIYRGETNVAQEQLKSLLKLANILQVKGLVDESNSEDNDEEGIDAYLSSLSTVGNSTKSSTAHSSDQNSVPHSTGGSNKVHEKSQIDVPPHEFSNPLWTYPGHPLASPQPQTEIPLSVLECMNKKIKEEPISDESPIIKNVLHRKRDYPRSRKEQRLGSCERPYRSHSNESVTEHRRHSTELSGRGHSPYGDLVLDDDEGNSLDPSQITGQGAVRNTPVQKPEWKKYKKYSLHDLESALEAMKDGLSPIAASKQFKVPSRTLYDKAKKMGINTRVIRRSISGSAAFPSGMGRNINGRIYFGLVESEYESTSGIPAENPSSSESYGRNPHHEDVPVDVSRTSPSLEIQSSTSNTNTEVTPEDLSIKRRRSDGGVILPTPKRLSEENVNSQHSEEK